MQSTRQKIISSESENDVEDRCVEVTADRGIWQEVEGGSTLGRTPINNIFDDVTDPIDNGKRNGMKGKVIITLYLLTV